MHSFRKVSFTLAFVFLFALPYNTLCEFINPCTWGCGDFHRKWTSYGQAERSYSDEHGCNCPPYLSTKGHKGCLQQYGIPGSFDVFYMKVCAERSPYSGYFFPKIRVRGKTCNVACWTDVYDLNANGECNYFASPLGIPTIRVCARVANPADPKGGPPVNADGTGPPTGLPADDGYTLGTQLDAKGQTIDDPVYIGSDGTPVNIIKPKVCAYYDPSLWDTLLNLAFAPISLIGLAATDQVGGASADAGVFDPDFTDVNPVQQPLHKTSGPSPFFQFIIAVLKAGKNPQEALGNLPSNPAFALPGGIGDALKTILSILKYSTFIQDAINSGLAKVTVAVLETIGQLNRVVAVHFGCVEVPIGPLPPPYCPSLGVIPQTIAVHPICSSSMKGGSLVTQLSTASTPCVSSSERNNFLHNSIRIGFDQEIPLCRGSDVQKAATDPEFDRCVNIIGFGGVSPSAAQLHAVSLNDVVKLCNPSGVVAPCVQSAYLREKHKGSWMETSGVRILYSLNASGSSTANYYYDTSDSLVDCSVNSNGLCQGVWGVNIGPYKDESIIFGDESGYNSDTKIESTILSDISGVNHVLHVVIPRQDTENAVQSKNQICVYKATDAAHENPLGCAIRGEASDPTVSSCSLNGGCATSFFYPKMYVTITIGDDSATGVVGPPINGNPSVQSKINLGGNDYTAYATDYDEDGISLIRAPFSGDNSVNPSSIFGKYLNNLVPYDGSTPEKTNSKALYLGGLEYKNNEYVAGGAQLCLDGYFNEDCITSVNSSPCMTKIGDDYTKCLESYQTNCVLTGLRNSTVMSCAAFSNLLMQYRGLTLCNPNKFCTLQLDGTYSCDNSKNCNSLQKTVSGINGKNVYVYKCSDESYCYNYSGRVGDNPLCEVTENPADRVKPEPSYGQFLSSSQYYPYNPQVSSNPSARTLGGAYDPKAPNYETQIIRNKTDIENSLCVSIPPMPDCSPVTSPTASDGKATWSSAHPGQESIGTCITGYAPIDDTKPLKRFCTIDKNLKASVLAPLDENVGCKSAGVSDIVINNSGLPAGCINNGSLSPGAINLAKCGISQGSSSSPKLFTSDITFNIGDISDVLSFKITQVGIDDYLLVNVNGSDVLMVRGDKGIVSSLPNMNVRQNDTFEYVLVSPNTNIIPYLKTGANLIRFNAWVVGGGGVSYKISYSVK